jgi:anaerobic magnesium-protoporphyrin IX monomethyl ester cyclase
MEPRIDVCLVSPPQRANSRMVPAALLYLHAWLVKSGLASRIVDVKRSSSDELTASQTNDVMERIVDRVRGLKPRFVGISCFTPEFLHVIELSRRLKQELDCRVIVGGTHPSLKPEDFFYGGSPVDYAVAGDGQNPLVDIVVQHNAGKAVATGEGIAHDRTTSQRALAAPADFSHYGEMPIPDYAQLDMDFYTRPNSSLARTLMLSGIHIFTTLGCPFRCTFCANRCHKVKYRPIEHVLDELTMLRDTYRIDAFYIQDDTFLLQRPRVIALVNGLRERKLDFVWAMETRVNLFDGEVAELSARNGCLQVDFGVESGSAEALKRMKKGITPEQIREAFDQCHKYGMRSLANIMFNTPGETDDDVAKTLELLRRIKPTRTLIGLTIPYPGAEIYETYVKPPVRKEEYHLFRMDQARLAIVDKRFAMAEHSRDLKMLREVATARFNGLRTFFDFTLSPVYWRRIMRSKRKLQYINAWTEGMLVQAKTKVLRHARLMFRRRQEPITTKE